MANIKTCKPTTFEGDRKTWPNFQRGVAIWASSEFPNADQYLKWASSKATDTSPIEDKVIKEDATEVHGDDTNELQEMLRFAHEFKRELYDLIGPEPRQVYHNADDEANGLEIWRMLKREYFPPGPSRNCYELNWIINPPLAKNYEDILKNLHAWERTVKEYSDTQKRPDYFPDDMKKIIVLKLLPIELARRLLDDMSRYNRYSDLKAEIVAQVERRAHGVDPFLPSSGGKDIGALDGTHHHGDGPCGYGGDFDHFSGYSPYDHYQAGEHGQYPMHAFGKGGLQGQGQREVSGLGCKGLRERLWQPSEHRVWQQRQEQGQG